MSAPPSDSAPEVALALSSSTGVISAAVGMIGGDPSGGALAAATLETDRRHAEEISPLILKLLADAGMTMADLGCLVVDVGPGRFTGLRVGLATVKTLSFALDVPVIGLTSLEVLAAGEAGLVTAVVDARRSEVFQQTFRDGAPLGPAVVGPAAELAPRASGRVVGDGVDRYLDLYGTSAPDEAEPVIGVHVDGAVMLRLAAGRSRRPGSAISPLYLRDPDVNPNVKTRPRA